MDNPQQFIALLRQILSLTQKPFPKVKGGLHVFHIHFLMCRFTPRRWENWTIGFQVLVSELTAMLPPIIEKTVVQGPEFVWRFCIN